MNPSLFKRPMRQEHAHPTDDRVTNERRVGSARSIKSASCFSAFGASPICGLFVSVPLGNSGNVQHDADRPRASDWNRTVTALLAPPDVSQPPLPAGPIRDHCGGL